MTKRYQYSNTNARWLKTAEKSRIHFLCHQGACIDVYTKMEQIWMLENCASTCSILHSPSLQIRQLSFSSFIETCSSHSAPNCCLSTLGLTVPWPQGSLGRRMDCWLVMSPHENFFSCFRFPFSHCEPVLCVCEAIEAKFFKAVALFSTVMHYLLFTISPTIIFKQKILLYHSLYLRPMDRFYVRLSISTDSLSLSLSLKTKFYVSAVKYDLINFHAQITECHKTLGSSLREVFLFAFNWFSLKNFLGYLPVNIWYVHADTLVDYTDFVNSGCIFLSTRKYT